MTLLQSVSKSKLFPLFKEKHWRSMGAVISFPLCVKSNEKYIIFLPSVSKFVLSNLLITLKQNKRTNVQCLLFFYSLRQNKIEFWKLSTVTNDSTGLLRRLLDSAIRFLMCWCSGSPLLIKNLNRYTKETELFSYIQRSVISSCTTPEDDSILQHKCFLDLFSNVNRMINNWFML